MSETATAPRGFDYRALHDALAELLGKQIFFVGGVAKSGTTWLQQLLDSHPQVSCGGESHFLNSLQPEIKKALEEHNRHVLDQKANTAYQLGKEPPLFAQDELFYITASAMLLLLRKQARDKTVLAVGEKTPFNIQGFAALANLIPGAKCLHIVRDPRDGVISGWHHIALAAPGLREDRFHTLPDYVEEYMAAWLFEIGRALKFAALSPEQYLELRYEDLVAEPGPTLSRVFRFLGVDAGERAVGSCIEGASFERLSGGRARGQEDPNSFFRKGVVGDWKGRLDSESLAYITEKAGPLMRRYGYL